VINYSNHDTVTALLTLHQLPCNNNNNDINDNNHNNIAIQGTFTHRPVEDESQPFQLFVVLGSILPPR